jgi:hypothetical protein
LNRAILALNRAIPALNRAILGGTVAGSAKFEECQRRGPLP